VNPAPEARPSTGWQVLGGCMITWRFKFNERQDYLERIDYGV